MGEQWVDAVRVGRHGIAPSDWDDFAIRCEGGYRSAYRHNTGWVLKRGPRARLRRFELVSRGPTGTRKVGQAVVGSTRRGGAFLDRLLLLPECQSLWPLAMEAVLRCLPDGVYAYGWEQNLEPPREQMLAAIPGVSVDRVRALVVECVDFASWPSWDAYYQAVSANVRRNVKKARSSIQDLEVVAERGTGSLRHLPAMVRLRSSMYQRKHLRFRALGAVVSTMANAFVGGTREFIALAVGDGRPLAAFRGSTFGRNTYYHDGGSVPDNHGAAWFLTVEMLRAAYERDPRGRFVMGYVDPQLHDEQLGGGLLRSRRACRVTDSPTSVVTFSWRGGGADHGVKGEPSDHVLPDQTFPWLSEPNAVTGP